LSAAQAAGFQHSGHNASTDDGLIENGRQGEILEQAPQRTTTQASFEPGVMQPALSPSVARSAKPSATPAAAQLDVVPPPASPETGQPARSVALRIPTGEGGAANVIVTDRAGQVHVTVRASDPALTQSLRSDLGSLASGLERQGFDVKVWNPSTGPSGDRETRAHSSELFGQDDARGQARHRHSPDDAEHRNRRQSEWSDDIE
jgi:hypothetical protein